MALPHMKPRGGTRGGAHRFSWDSVKESKYRSNYLGNSLMAATGRSAQSINWYSRTDTTEGITGVATAGSQLIEKMAAERAAVKAEEERQRQEMLGITPFNSQATNQTTNQSISQSKAQSNVQLTAKSTNQPTARSAHQSTVQSTSQSNSRNLVNQSAVKVEANPKPSNNQSISGPADKHKRPDDWSSRHSKSDKHHSRRSRSRSPYQKSTNQSINQSGPSREHHSRTHSHRDRSRSRSPHRRSHHTTSNHYWSERSSISQSISQSANQSISQSSSSRHHSDSDRDRENDRNSHHSRRSRSRSRERRHR